jgi:cation transporter-like permease
MNETGRKVFFWYRAYCAFLVLLYVAVTIGGIALAVIRPESSEYRAEEFMLVGIIYAVTGAVMAVVFTVALLLPPKPYNWIVGVIMIAIGMTSCCFVPVCVPLLIYWFKPETKAFFGRNE